MAADGYVKAAFSELTSAVTQLQSEIGQLQHQLDQNRQNLHSDISKLELEQNAHKVALASDNDDSQKNFLLTRMRSIGGKADQKKSEISNMESDLSNQIQSKQQALGTIQGAANQINSLLNLPGIR